MAIRNIVTEGDPILRKQCREVRVINDHIKELMQDMLETMRLKQGVGIAGPQVGVMRRLFVAEPEPGRVYYMINPVILSSEGAVTDIEGCLSVPGLMGEVERPDKIVIRAMDLDGSTRDLEMEGFDARVMCHEYDHLEGILYTDKAIDLFEPEEELEEPESEE